MDEVFKFIGAEPFKLDFDNIKQTTVEADSYYRFKYPHLIKNKLTVPDFAPVSPRILSTVISKFEWFYKSYYPEIFIGKEVQKQSQLTPLEEQIAKEIEDEIG
jgi:sulfotransferase